MGVPRAVSVLSKPNLSLHKYLTFSFSLYLRKVAEDMEATKTALEGNRKLQVLQMKAIDAVWRKLDGSDVEGLAASCINLTRQVEELRGLVQLLQANGQPPQVPTSTQTDIVAVRTPQGTSTTAISRRFSRTTSTWQSLLILEIFLFKGSYNITASLSDWSEWGQTKLSSRNETISRFFWTKCGKFEL